MTEKQLDILLKGVQKPGRYTGGELNSVIKDIVYEDLSENNFEGVWNSETQILKLNKEFLEIKQDNSKEHNMHLHVAIHEMLHALSRGIDQNGQCVSGIIKRSGKEQFRGGGFNEGITEFLAQKILPTKKELYKRGGIEFNCAGAYALEQVFIKELAVLYGEENIIKSYLNNQI